MKLGRAEPFVAALGSLLIRLLAATWRFRETGGEHIARLRRDRRPFLFALWHSRILPLLYYHRHQGIVLLISRHRDGGYLADLSASLGYGAVRGSTNRGGEVGLLGIVRALQGGAEVAVTPDGPRGPAEQVQPGAVAAAQHAGAPLLPLSARARSAWYLGSWDRMCIPKPFARVEIVYGAPIYVAEGKAELRRGMNALEQGLRGVTTGGGS